MTTPSTEEPRVFTDPESGEEYARIPADEFPVGDDLESTDFTEPAGVGLKTAFGVVRGEYGWIANDRSFIASYTVPGTTCRLALRKGDVSVVLLDWAAWYDREIEPLVGGTLDDWGYAERMVRGSTTTRSRHSWGGAIDLDAIKHPMGKRNTFSPEQQRKIRAKIREYNGVLRWGGDYTTRPDDMHYEINGGPAAVAREANRIRGKQRLSPAPPSTRPTPAPFGYTSKGDRVLGLHTPLLEGKDVEGVRNALRVAGNQDIAAKGPYNRPVADRMNTFKANRNIKEDGCGAKCWDALRKLVHG